MSNASTYLYYGFHVKSEISSELFEELQNLLDERNNGLKFQGVYIGDASIFEQEYFFGKVISSVFEYGFEEFTELLSQNEKEQIEKEILSLLEQYQMKPSKNKASYYLSLLDY